jgi:hypothetical protein
MTKPRRDFYTIYLDLMGYRRNEYIGRGENDDGLDDIFVRNDFDF